MWILFAIIFVLSLLVVAGMFVVRFYELNNPAEIRVRVSTAHPVRQERLWSYFRRKFGAAARKLWHFILEAKDLMPATTRSIHDQAEKVKNVFRIRIRSSQADPQWLPEAAELVVKPTTNQSPEDRYLAAIQKNPNDITSYEALGRLYLQNRNYSDAVETYEFLTKLDPTHDSFFSNLGLAYYSQGEYEKAKVAYERALNINNKIPTRWINLSLCFEALEDHGKTVKAILSALQFDKMNVNYLVMLADAYLKIPNNVRAEEVLEQILSIEPTNKSAREKLMRLKI